MVEGKNTNILIQIKDDKQLREQRDAIFDLNIAVLKNSKCKDAQMVARNLPLLKRLSSGEIKKQ